MKLVACFISDIFFFSLFKGLRIVRSPLNLQKCIKSFNHKVRDFNEQNLYLKSKILQCLYKNQSAFVLVTLCLFEDEHNRRSAICLTIYHEHGWIFSRRRKCCYCSFHGDSPIVYLDNQLKIKSKETVTRRCSTKQMF